MSWESWVVGGAAVLLVPYVIGPIAVKASMRFNPQPTMRAIDPALEPIPEEIRSLAAASDPEFIGLGFERGPLLRIDGIMANMHSYSAMYARRDGWHQAMVTVIFAANRPKRGYVEISTTFKGDRSVMTHNTPELSFGPKVEESIVIKAPWIGSVSSLFELHKEACRRYGMGETKSFPADRWAESSIMESLDKFVKRGVTHGYMSANADGTYGLTWKGALIGTYTNLPPGNIFARRNALARAKELQRFAPGLA